MNYHVIGGKNSVVRIVALSAVIILILVSVAYVRKISLTIHVTSPSVGQAVDTEFTVSGTVPSTWLERDGFGASITSPDGTEYTGQWIDTTPVSFWGKFFGVNVPFSGTTGVAGMEGQATLTGKAILTFSNYEENKQVSFPIIIQPKKSLQ